MNKIEDYKESEMLSRGLWFNEQGLEVDRYGDCAVRVFDASVMHEGAGLAGNRYAHELFDPVRYAGLKPWRKNTIDY